MHQLEFILPLHLQDSHRIKNLAPFLPILMCALLSQKPIIAICGTTGVGKSRLAVELAISLQKSASRLTSRIINADSMQVYEGLDIITNKIPLEQRQGIEHLLMGFKSPGDQYEVGEWVKDAMAAVYFFKMSFQK